MIEGSRRVMTRRRKRLRGVDDSSQKSNRPASEQGPPKKNPRLNRHDSHASLCGRCAEIDFDEIFGTRVNRSLGEFVLDLTETPDKLKVSSCAFCRVLATILPVTFEETSDSSGGQYHVRAFSANRSFAGPNWKNFLGEDSTFIGVVQISKALAKSGKGGALLKINKSLSETGYLGILQDSKPTDSFGIRRLCQATFDEKFVADCISYCTEHHGQACNDVYNPKESRSRTSSLSFRVIDCSSRRIVKAVLGCRYVALSYLWGSEQCCPPDSLLENQEPALPNDCPRVVNDSIDVALKLGYQYLWVDRYCIDQENPHDKALQISQMDRIYANAHITIIAAAGTGPEYGLPGANQKLRKPQPILKIGELTLACSLPRPKSSITKSKWATRGWTFQEGVLSKRRLIFTDEQVAFECNTMDCAEVLWKPTSSLHCKIIGENGKQELRAGIPSASYHHGSTGSVPLDIVAHLSDFTRRELTYSSDAINAFQGIFHVFARSQEPTHQLVGIPMLPPVHLRKTNAYFPPFRDPAVGFLVGLSWFHIRPGKRRPQFPSWSWAGWEGQIGDTLLWTAFWEEDSFDIDIAWIEELDGKRLRFPSFYEGREGLNDFLDPRLQDTVKFIGITAETSPCKVTYIDIDKDLDDEDRESKIAPMFSGFYIEMPLGDGSSRVYAPACLDGRTEELLGDEILCIMFHGDPKLHKAIKEEQWFLLVHGMEVNAKMPGANKMCYERVGSAAFHEGFVKTDGIWAGRSKWSVDGEEIEVRERKTLRLG